MPKDPRPNIVLITTDQQRYDTLGVNGSSWIATAHLDQLATRGVNFHNAFVQNTVCIPSRACIQTGRYTHQHGLQYMDPVIDDGPALRPWEITFMERLQHAGYYTAAFGKIHMLPITPARGFHEQKLTGGKGQRWTKSAGLPIGLGPLGRDYAAWLEARHPGAYEAIYAQRRQPEYRAYHTAMTHVLPLEEYVDTWIAGNTVEFLRRDHDKPFFLHCGLTGPHGPVVVPAPYATLYAEDDVVLPPNYRVDMDGHPRETSEQQDRVARRWWAHYAGLVTLMDDLVGQIIGALEETGLIEDTLVLVTSDHGDMAFERGRGGKSLFFEPVIHVPLIAVPPGGLPAGREVGGVVEVYDLAPTILDYALAEIPATMSAASLRPLVEDTGPTRKLALSEFVSGDGTLRGTCVRTPRGKYEYWSSGEERFYDLEADPLERENRIHDPGCRDEVSRHRTLLIDRLIQTPA